MTQLDTQQLETELLSAILSPSNRNRTTEWVQQLTPDDFTGIRYDIFKACQKLHNNGQRISRTTVQRGLDFQDPVQVLNRFQEVINPTEVPGTIRQLKDLAERRRIHTALTETQSGILSAETSGEALQAALAAITGLMESTEPDDVVDIATALEEWSQKMAEPEATRRIIPTPWPSLNENMAGGLHPGRTYIFGARPGVGKSLSGVNIATYAAYKGYPSAIFSAEMPTFEVTSRIVAASTQSRYGNIVARQIEQDEAEVIELWKQHVAETKMPLFIADKPGMTVESIMAQARALKRTRGLDVIFVDYLQLIKESDTRVPRERQVAHISWSLKQLAKELGIAVVIAAQLNRNSVNEDKPPQLQELRESGSIEQDADVVILIDKKMIEGQFQGEVVFYIRKNRTGALTEVPLAFRGHVARIDDFGTN